MANKHHALSTGADAVLRTGKSVFDGFHIPPPTSGNAVLTVYDGTSEEGTVILLLVVPSTALSGLTNTGFDARCDNGIFVTLTGTGNADAHIFYR